MEDGKVDATSQNGNPAFGTEKTSITSDDQLHSMNQCLSSFEGFVVFSFLTKFLFCNNSGKYHAKMGDYIPYLKQGFRCQEFGRIAENH